MQKLRDLLAMYRQGLIGAGVTLLVVLVLRGVWNLYWLERWQSQALWEHQQALQQIVGWINAQQPVKGPGKP